MVGQAQHRPFGARLTKRKNVCDNADAGIERREASNCVVDLVNDTIAIDLVLWISDLLNLEYNPCQDLGPSASANKTERSCPSDCGVCDALIYEPFQHGLAMQFTDLAPCWDCHNMDNRWLLFCINCRDDRPMVRSEYMTCLSGYCKCKETNSHE